MKILNLEYSKILTFSCKILYNNSNKLSFGGYMIFHQPHNSKTNYNYNAFFYQKEKWDPHFHKNFEVIYVLEGICILMFVHFSVIKTIKRIQKNYANRLKRDN